MREDRAIELVEQKFNSLEEFGWAILTDFPEVVEGDYSLDALAKKLGLGRYMAELGTVLRGPTFRGLITRLVVAAEWTIYDEMQHVKSVKEDAINKEKGLTTRITAREHLAKLSGTPLSARTEQAIVPIQINFGMVSLAETKNDLEDGKTITVESQSSLAMAREGDLPPPGARRKYNSSRSARPDGGPLAPGAELDFTSDESPYSQREPFDPERETPEQPLDSRGDSKHNSDAA